MVALVVHIGEGCTHVLLASNRREDVAEQAGPRRRTILDGPPAGSEDEERHNRLFILHDQLLRNGADLSLRYRQALEPALRETLLRQAAEAVHRFRGLAGRVMVAASADLLVEPAQPTQDPLVAEFQRQLDMELRVLTPADEALWLLRGVRGIYPTGELACVQTGHWRTVGAWEIPGRLPQLQNWACGCSRPADPAAGGAAFPGLRSPTGQPLYVAGEHVWQCAALHIGLTFHNMDLLDDTILDDKDLRGLDGLLGGLSIEERNLIPMVGGQGDCLPEALRLLRQLLAESGATRLQVCSRGLAHGLASHLLYEGRARPA